MGDQAVRYAPRPDATPEREAAALAAVYRFVLDASKRKAAGTNGGGDDGRRIKHDPATPILPSR